VLEGREFSSPRHGTFLAIKSTNKLLDDSLLGNSVDVNKFRRDGQRERTSRLFRVGYADLHFNKGRTIRREKSIFSDILFHVSSAHSDFDVAIGKRYWEVALVNQHHAYLHFILERSRTHPPIKINPLIERRFHKASLTFNGLERPISCLHATPADHDQKKSERRRPESSPSSQAVIEFVALIVSFSFGGISLALWVLENVDEDRRILRASLIALGLGSFAIGWLLWILWLPFGLPPRWPARYPYYKGKPQSSLVHGVIVSQKLLTAARFTYYNKYMANVLGTDKQIGIIGALCEGSSIRSIERTTGVHRDTIMRLGVKVGKGCTALMDAKMRNLDCHRLEMDEIWGYVGKKEKHVRPGDDPQFGNVWTFCAIDADTKLVPTFRVGSDRDAKTATAFMLDVADRMKNRVQISTDGLAAYVEAIDWAFGRNVDYGQIIKVYGTEESIEAQRRYSAPKITMSEKKAVFGRPDFDLISTSYVERLNATTRLHVKRLARLTHAFSKKRDNFEAAVGLHFAYYNFVRRHNTLRCTPAMAAGVEQSFWSVGELLEAAAA
jgi:IS1 family transposase